MRSEHAWCEAEVDANETTSSNQSEAGDQKQGQGFVPTPEIENCEGTWAQGAYEVFPATALLSLVDKYLEDCGFMKGAPAINKPAHLTENVSSEECAGT